MAVEQPAEPGRLPCGNTLDSLLSDLRAGRTGEHERGCPHCRAEADRYRVLLDAEAAEAEAGPSAPPDLVDRVMLAVRAEGRPGRRIGVRGAGPGRTRVRESTLAAIVRAACADVPGAAVGRCRILDEEDGPAVELTVRLTERVPVPRLADALRAAARRAVQDQLGRAPSRVDVLVADVE
ncbi:hypothetical protein J0910_19490 [Nocardiopsis sp. CNT-189]|uniref:hypothetical protein n=1 Tax=Nocardiopsis oceanisediminis TaxID=2816862 RepID=UPI003B30310C